MKYNEKFISETAKLKTPFIVFDLERIKSNYLQIQKAFPNISVHYAMKCNPLREIIDTLKQSGAGFEVASLAETKQLLKQGVHPSKIMCLHPIKSPEFLKYLAKNKISVVAADSYEELDKIAKFAPNSKILMRVAVDNVGSSWPLTRKFGIEVTEFPKVFRYALSLGLKLGGLTFHVGSQCENEANWLKALDLCNSIWHDCQKENIDLDFLSLGGGLAVRYNKPVPEWGKIGEIVRRKISQNFKSKKGLTVTIEPGRAVVADAAVLVTSVMGVAKRGNDNWAYIETGTYNGLIEAIETPDRNFYPIFVDKEVGNKQEYYIGGPSCVSLDTPFEKVLLPKLSVSDRVYISNTGAYTLTCSAPFNGFPTAKVYFRQIYD